MSSLFPCVKCHGLMTLDYCCSGCRQAIHWFCSEGDKDSNESKGHGAHYWCAGCSKKLSTNVATTNVSSPRRSPRHSPHLKETAKKRSKGGVKKGSKCLDKKRNEREDLSHSFWYDLCQKYEAGKWKSETIKQYLSEKNMDKELLQFETFQHKMRVKRIDAATSQLSIKSFFKKKRCD